MAKAGNLVSPRSLNPVFNPCHPASKVKTLRLLSQIQTYNNASASTKRKDNLQSPLIGKNTSRAARRLITISTGDGKWHGDWTCDYLLSLQDLQLQDLIEVENDRHKDAQVCINLSIQKHASFGLSVDGRIMTSFTRKCCNCSSPYCRRIDTKFNVWVLSASRDNRKIRLPEIGDVTTIINSVFNGYSFYHHISRGNGNAHTKFSQGMVIYVKPGYEVDLDHLVQETIRLTTSVKDTCSELCEKSEATVQYTTGQSRASVDKRWSRLLELKKANF